MSDPVLVTDLAAGSFATVRSHGPLGMITLRAKGLKTLDKAIKAAVGVTLPAPRRIVTEGGRSCAWMSPDEYLLVLPEDEVQKALAAIAKALGAAHHLAVDVSDARAVFRIEGPKAGDVLRKLCPVALDAMAPDEMRRTRAAQVAVAFWRDGDGYTLVSFRSVAGYVEGLLSHAARAGSALG
jgi:sarcosine oxidase, subunit gamma